MKSPKDRKPLFERLKTGMEEAIRHARGEITLKTTVVEIPDPPPELPPEELTRLRVGKGMSQDVFARLLNVPTRTVRSWEDGTRKPSQAALRLIQVFREDPAGVLEIVGMTADRPPATPRKPRPAPRTKNRATREGAP
jgi:putative transcriptional regulator